VAFGYRVLMSIQMAILLHRHADEIEKSARRGFYFPEGWASAGQAARSKPAVSDWWTDAWSSWCVSDYNLTMRRLAMSPRAGVDTPPNMGPKDKTRHLCVLSGEEAKQWELDACCLREAAEREAHGSQDD
jgi:hypothetical protein